MPNQSTPPSTAPQTPQEAALAYAAIGWWVFPCWPIRDGACACPAGDRCNSPGKHPITPRGLHDASTDAKTIREWWDRWPDAHVAIKTGIDSRIVVVDLDRKPGKNGVESLKALGPVPETHTVRTGSGGLHLYYRHPGGRVPCSSGKLGAGIDIRGDGGYVIAPPSGHISGGNYVLA